MKKRALFLMTMLLVLLAALTITASAASSGTCGAEGSSVSWALDDSGTLTISGTGAMADCEYSYNTPWYGTRSTIQNVVVGSGVTHIGNYAFYDMDSLTSVTLPATVTTIGNYAFQSCGGLTGITLPTGLTAIGDNAFSFTALTRVTVPSKVTAIGAGAFRNCDSLASVTISGGPVTIGSSAFSSCSALTSVSLAAGVTSIGEEAFRDCTGLTILSIPAGVTSIGEDAFQNCSKLSTFAVASGNAAYTAVDGVLFSKDKTTLVRYPLGKTGDSYTVPDGVTTIGPGAFGRSTETSTGQITFNKALGEYGAALKSVVLPDSVTTIASSAFLRCVELESINLPSGLTTIGSRAFFECRSLPSMTIPSGVTVIDRQTFYGCSALASVTLPENLTTIGSYAFDGCSALTNVTIPASVTGLYASTFNNCSSMTAFTVAEDNTAYCSVDGVLFNESMTTLIEYPAKKTAAAYTIPDGVTNAISFNGNDDLTSVTIPASVTTLGTYAFQDCTDLGSVTFLGDPPTMSGNYIFSGVVAEVFYPTSNANWTADVMKQYGGTLLWGGGIDSGTCGTGVKWVLSTDGRLSISGVGTMNDYSETDPAPWYNYRSFITDLTVGSGVTAIGDYAFADCTELTDVSLSCGLGAHAFDGCTGLNWVELGAGTLEAQVFSGCTALDDVIFLGEEPTLNANAFGGTVGVTCWYPHEAANEVSYGLDITPWTGTAAEATGDDVNWVDWWAPGWGMNGQVLLYNLGTETDEDMGSDLMSAINYCMVLVEEGYPVTAPVHFRVAEGLETIADLDHVIISPATELTLPSTVSSIGTDGSTSITSYLEKITFTGSAPAIADNLFYYLNNNVTCYYPANDSSWDVFVEDNEQFGAQGGDYYGSVTWVAYVPIVASGTCGDNLDWVLTSDGKLTISGEGAMENYSWSGAAPWYDYKTSIKKVVVETGVTYVGKNAFYGYANLTEASIASTVAQIGEYAFRECSALTTVTLAEGLVEIDDHAFYNCTELANITVPSTVTRIGVYAFLNCASLTKINIPDGVQYICYNSFQGCSGLTSITLPAGIRMIDNQAFLGCTGLTKVIFTGDAPTIISTSFVNVKAVCIYPADNATWTTDKFDNYGGSLTWMPDNVLAFGTCDASDSDNVSWMLTDDGVLTISGTGAMAQYDSADLPPWENWRTSVETLVVEDGITNVASFFNHTALTGVTLGADVEAIEATAFSGCNMLESITIPDSVKTIGQYAFSACTKLADVTLGSGVTAIATMAFNNCDALKTITIPASVTSLGSQVFLNSDALESVHVEEGNTKFCSVSGVLYSADMTKLLVYPKVKTGASFVIPDGVTTIGVSAFTGNKNLTALTIPDGLTKVDTYAFTSCSNLKSITFQGSAPASVHSGAFYGVTATCYYPAGDTTWTDTVMQDYSGTLTWQKTYVANGTSGSDLTWTLDKNGLLTISGTGAMADYYSDNVPWYNYRRDIKKVAIESGVTSIGNNAFYYCDLSGGITIPDSVTDIGSYAFCQSNLPEITVPDGVTVIEEGTFRDIYPELTTVNLPDGITSIGAYAFEGCDKLSDLTLPANLETIGNSAFANCYTLEEITIPAGVTSIGNNAFDGCTGITALTFEGDTPTLGEWAFYSCSALTEIRFSGKAGTSDSTAFSGVTAACFYPLSDTSWTATAKSAYGGSMRWIAGECVDGGTCDTGAFWALTADGTLTLYSLTSVGIMDDYTDASATPWADHADDIRKVVVEYAVTTIGDYAFSGCSKLTDVSISAYVRTMGDHVFSQCPALKNITVATGNNSFLVEDGVLFNRDGTKLIQYPAGSTTTTYTVPDGVTEIGTGAFAGSKNLTSVTLPDGLQTIGGSAFFSCSALEKITLPASVDTVEQEAFCYCTALTEVTFEGSAPTTFSSTIFGSVTATVYYPAGNTTWNEIVSANEQYGGTLKWEKSYVASGTCGEDLTWTLDGEGVLTISGTGAMNDYSVLGAPWYKYADDIKTVAIESGVATIGKNAFYNLTALKSAGIPSSVTAIGYEAFGQCRALSDISIPYGVTDIGGGAFAWCAMTELTIPDSVTAIGDSAFWHCSALTEVTISKNITSIGNGVFYACTSLKSVTIPSKVISIGCNALAECTELETVAIPDGMKTIGNNAFFRCPALKSVGIPASVTDIGAGAFDSCGGITEVTFGGDVPAIVYDAFYGVTATVYYPAGNTTWTDDVMQDYGGTLTWVPDNAVDWGTCGDNLTWEMDDNGVLTISGSGGMTDYTVSAHAPWYDYREQITAVRFAPTITSIGAFAFQSCTELTDVEIGAGITTIGTYAFHTCSALTKVTIPVNVTTIQDGPFPGCEKLTEISVVEGNTSFTSVDGVLFNNAKTQLIQYPAGKTASSYTIPDGVTEICYAAFYHCQNLTEVTIPEGVTNTGTSAFKGTTLTKVILPSTLTKLGNQTFKDCADLTEVTFTGNAPMIASNAFINTTVTCYYPGEDETWTDAKRNDYGGELTWLPYGTCGDGVNWTLDNTGTLIISGSGAMEDYSANDDTRPWSSYNDSITQIVIDQHTTKVGFIAFRNCANLTAITVDKDNANYSTVDGVLFNKDKTTLIQYPAGKSDTRYEVPDTVTSLSYCAFYACNALTEVTMPDTLSSIGSHAFCNSKGLQCVAIPSGVTSISRYAFAGCSGLKSVTMHENVTEIGECAFFACQSLTEIELPKSLNVFGNGAFADSKLTNIYYAGSEKQWADLTASGTDLYPADVTIHCNDSDPVSITTQPTDQSAASGEYVYFTVAANGGSGTLTYNWQWKGSGGWNETTLPGHDGPTLKVPVSTDTNGRQYQCIVTDSNGNSVTSEAATLTLRVALSITTHPTDQSAATGEYVYFTVAANGGSGTLTYNWQWKGSGGWNETTLPGHDGPTLKVPVSTDTNGRQYQCIITDSYGNSVTSNAATLHRSVPLLSAPVLTEAFNSSTGVRVSWKAVEGAECYRLLRKNVTKGEGDWSNVGETTECTLIDKTVASASRYTFTVECIDADGNVISERDETGRTCTYIAMAKITSVTSKDEGLEIVWQKPAGAKNFRVMRKVEGGAWQVLTTDQITSYLDTTVEAGVKYWYTVRAVTLAGDMYINSYNSYGWSGTWQGLPLKITAQPEDQTAPGGYVYFTVAANGGSGTLTYNWQWKGSGGWNETTLPGHDGPTLKVPVSTDTNGRQYHCIVTDSNGNNVTSEAATLTLRVALSITTQPADQSAATGEYVYFTVAANGGSGTLTYRWQWKGSGSWNETTLPGHDGPTLKVPVSTATNGRQYQCIVTDSNGNSETSEAATLTLTTTLTVE